MALDEARLSNQDPHRVSLWTKKTSRISYLGGTSKAKSFLLTVFLHLIYLVRIFEAHGGLIFGPMDFFSLSAIPCMHEHHRTWQATDHL